MLVVSVSPRKSQAQHGTSSPPHTDYSPSHIKGVASHKIVSDGKSTRISHQIIHV